MGQSSNFAEPGMLIVFTVFLFIFISVAMLIIHVVRPRLSVQGFLTVLGVVIGLVLVAVAKSQIPSTITLLNWSPETLFPMKPSLMLDEVSWLFALAVTSLSVAIVISSITQIGQVAKGNPAPDQNEAMTVIDEVTPRQIPEIDDSTYRMPNWLFWITVLVVSSLGLVAVTAGNLLTLLLSWVALDMVEVIVLIGHTLKSESRERAAIVFSAKTGSTIILLVAGLVLWSKGGSLDFYALSPTISTLAIFAVAIRLGVLPPMIPYSHRIPIRRDLATLLLMVPAAAAYILLARVASNGVSGAITPYLVSLAAIISLVFAYQGLTATDVQTRSQSWLVSCSSLAVISALLNQPAACAAWSLAGLLSGGLAFSFSLRHRYLLPIIVLGVFNLSALPFSPTWQAASLFGGIQSVITSRLLYFIFIILLLAIQATLLAGCIRYLVGDSFRSADNQSTHVERWVWVLYPVELIVIVMTHLVIGWFLRPVTGNLPFFAWIIGPITLLAAGLITFGNFRLTGRNKPFLQSVKTSGWSRLLTNDRLYNLVWRFYRSATRVSVLISTILEGEGGILWALVLFALIFVFLQR